MLCLLEGIRLFTKYRLQMFVLSHMSQNPGEIIIFMCLWEIYPND